MPELARDREPGARRPEEDAGGTERPGGEDDDVGGYELGRSPEHVAPLPADVERHLPHTAVTRLDGPDVDLGEDLRAVRVGVGQVVHQHGVLRAVIAPGDTVATSRARRLV